MHTPRPFPRYARAFLCLTMCALLLSPLLALAEGRVRVVDSPPAQETSAQALDLYVLPLLGADCMLLRQGEAWMLVDMGTKQHYPAIREALEQLGVQRIDIALNTHPHRDHIGGMPQIARDYPVGRFLTAFAEDYQAPGAQQAPVLRALRERDIPVERIGDGDRFALGDAQVQVLQARYWDTNNASAALMITHGGVRMLLGADVTQQGQQLLAEQYGQALKADLLKYPHHGLELLAPPFLQAVSPSFALFTHGSIQTRGAQGLLDAHGVPYLFATWGQIHVRSDGESLVIYQPLSEKYQQYKQWYEQRKR